MKKFKLTENTRVNAYGVTLFQIECTIKTKYASVGDLGGWIESEEVSGKARISGDAWVSGNAEVFGNAQVSGNAWVSGDVDYCCFQSFGSSGRTTTAFKEKSGLIRVRCGCFDGDLEAFCRRVEQTHGDNIHGRTYKAIIEVIKVKFNL